MVVRATHRSTRRLTLTRVFCKKWTACDPSPAGRRASLQRSSPPGRASPLRRTPGTRDAEDAPSWRRRLRPDRLDTKDASDEGRRGRSRCFPHALEPSRKASSPNVPGPALF